MYCLFSNKSEFTAEITLLLVVCGIFSILIYSKNMTNMLLSAKQAVEREVNDSKRIQQMRRQSILRRGVAFLPFTLFSPLAERYTLDLCLRQKCAMEIMSHHVMICPVHWTVHRCGDGHCRFVASQGCVFSMRSAEPECPIEDDAFLNMPHKKEEGVVHSSALVSFPCSGSARSAYTREELLWFSKEKLFRKAIVETIGTLCNSKKRARYNAINSDRTNALKPISSRDVGLQVLLERDLHNLCMTLIRAAGKKKDRRLLLDNVHTFVFIALGKFLKGLYENGVPVLRAPCYAKRLIPFPKKKDYEKSFHMTLQRYSKCLKGVQAIYQGKVFHSFIKQKLPALHRLQ